MPLERPPDVGSLVEAGDSVGPKVDGVIGEVFVGGDVPELAEVVDVEPEPVEVDVELEYVVLAEKIQPFI